MSVSADDVAKMARALRVGRMRREAVRNQYPLIGLTTVLTCDSCPLVETCPSAFNAYNTDGDCLEEK